MPGNIVSGVGQLKGEPRLTDVDEGRLMTYKATSLALVLRPVWSGTLP